MIFVGLLPVSCCIIWILGLLFKNMKMHRREWVVFGFMFISGMAAVAFSANNPPSSWDLSRHYELIEAMKQGGLNYILTQSKYTHLPVVNMFFALFAAVGVQQLLPCVTTIICYGILAYILADFVSSEKTDSRCVACIIIFNLALCPFFHMVSGIRNVLNFSMMALGFYLELKKGRRIIGWLLYIASVFIHPSAVLLIAMRLFLPIYKRFTWLGIFVALWSLMADVLGYILICMPIRFLADVGFKLRAYLYPTETSLGFSGHKILLVKYALLISLFLIMWFVFHKEKKALDKPLQNMIAIMELTILLVVGSFKIEFIADRLCFFVAFMAVPALIMLYNRCRGRLRYFFAAETSAVGALLFLHQLIYFIRG